jgi:hypothetical protein
MLEFVEVGVKTVVVVVNGNGELLEPGVKWGQSFGCNLVGAIATMGPATYKPNITQHAQVFRHDGLGQIDSVNQFVDRCLAVRKCVEKTSSIRISHGVEHVGRSCGSRHAS